MAVRSSQLVLCLLAVSTVCVLSVDLSQDQEEERECFGAEQGFSYSGGVLFHYQQMKKRYAGCTHVVGNIEITHLEDPAIDYDLSFLSSIRYVSGYVLIALNSEVESIPLLNLEVIRGNKTISLTGHDEEFSLAVVLTSRADGSFGLKELLLPKLKEITNGNVVFKKNPLLGFADTIDWSAILRGREDGVVVQLDGIDLSVSEEGDSSVCDGGKRWGNSPSLCQEVLSDYKICHEDCDGRCYGPSSKECCHATCAVGCSGPENTDCFRCKDYRYDAQCVGFCPAKSYPLTQECVKY